MFIDSIVARGAHCSLRTEHRISRIIETSHYSVTIIQTCKNEKRLRNHTDYLMLWEIFSEKAWVQVEQAGRLNK